MAHPRAAVENWLQPGRRQVQVARRRRQRVADIFDAFDDLFDITRVVSPLRVLGGHQTLIALQLSVPGSWHSQHATKVSSGIKRPPPCLTDLAQPVLKSC